MCTSSDSAGELLEQARQRTASDGLGEQVSRPLREALPEAPDKAAGQPPFRLVTFGDPQHPVAHEPKDFAAVLDEEDAAARR